MFILQNTDTPAMTLGDLKISNISHIEGIQAQFDLIFNITETSKGLCIGIEYCKDLFDKSTIAKLAYYYQRFIETAVDFPNKRLSDINILSNEELQQLQHWNIMQLESLEENRLHLLFEQTVEKSEDKTALVYEEKQLSYATLNQLANKLAHVLIKHKVAPENLIGISVPKELELIIGLLAILKSGGTYVPLDPEYPQDRLNYMIKDANLTIVLTIRALEKRFSDFKGVVIFIEEDEDFLRQSSANLNISILPDSLAYIIYTSRSTGKPKGVAMSHRSIVNRMLWMKKKYFTEINPIVLQKASYNFDASLWEIFIPLICGGKLVLLSNEEAKDIYALEGLIKRHQINSIEFTPSVIALLLDTDILKYPCLKYIFSSSEPLSASLFNKYRKTNYSAKIINLYGPTEAAIDSTSYECENKNYKSDIPIGRPITNTQVYILDEILNLVPIGMIGEIYIDGIGLARGYLNKPGVTAEKFLPNPFRSNSRLYKTGDMGRYLPDGNIEFLGRIDNQISLRGFRVELGEIESIIQTISGVSQVIVLLREDRPNQKQLIAYIVPKVQENKHAGKEELNYLLINTIKQTCQDKLPDYMQPNFIVIIDQLPITLNGKIDKKALPRPKERDGLAQYQKPIGRIEEKLAVIWSELLKVGQVSRDDDFFDLGGHSLLATQLIARLRSRENIEVPLKAIFEHRTLSNLAHYLNRTQLKEGLLPPITLVPRDVPHVLSFAQQRLWFMEQLLPSIGLYHNVSSFKLLGNLNVPALREALDALVMRHEILRTIIINENGIGLQKISSEIIGFEFKENTEVAEDINLFIKRPFNFETEALCRALLLKHSNQEHKLIFVFHHMIMDGWSMDIFYQDLWQRNWLCGEILSKQLNFWQNQLQNIKDLMLPTDYPRPKILSYCGGYVVANLSQDISHVFDDYAKHYQITPFTLEKQLRNINLLLPEEQSLLSQWNKTQVHYPKANSIHQLFEATVVRIPDNIALVCNERTITYRELNAKANQVAHYLLTLGAGPEIPVAIAIDRSIELIIGLLGILKAGSVYVPLDTSYPQERLAYMITNSQASIIITRSKEYENLPASYSLEIILDEITGTLAQFSTNNPIVSLNPENLAYIIYTSGSTGKPKGVGVSNGSVISYLLSTRSLYQADCSSTVLLHGSVCFDMSITSVWMPLLTGNPIRIIEDEFSVMLEALNLKERFAWIKLTPSHLRLIKESSCKDLKALSKCIIVGGEALKDLDISSDNDLVIYNEYGPTEATVACSVYKISEVCVGQNIPIGKPLHNMQIYVLDKHLNEVPIGVAGEIYIGGAGLARGYMSQPDLTAEKFIPNHLLPECIDGKQFSGQRLYKTGDLGRYAPDGNLEFLGRIDYQIKIKGFRIELGEIESVVQSVLGVQQALVLCREDIPNQKRLVIYAVGSSLIDLEFEERVELETKLIKNIQLVCQQQLPAYMQPNLIVLLDKFPLTQS
ncbi:unnamed protein product, partial [Rotaria sordida]